MLNVTDHKRGNQRNQKNQKGNLTCVPRRKVIERKERQEIGSGQ